MNLARILNDFERRLRDAERSRQMGSSSVETLDGEAVPVADALVSGVTAEAAVSEITDVVADVQEAVLDTANLGEAAQAAADEAAAAAVVAQDTATAAQAAADAASAAAASAVSDVDAAVTAANDAATAAAAAKAKADTAASDAATAQSTASSAASAASSAQSTANTASSTASAAKSTADAVNTLTTGWKKTGTTAIDGGAIYADSIGAGQIAADAILARNIKAGEITAAKMAVNTITAASGVIASIDAAKITVGQITSAQIAAGAIKAANIATGALDAVTITGATYQSAPSGARWVFQGGGWANTLFGYSGVAGEASPAGILSTNVRRGMLQLRGPDSGGGQARIQLANTPEGQTPSTSSPYIDGYADAITWIGTKRSSLAAANSMVDTWAAGQMTTRDGDVSAGVTVQTEPGTAAEIVGDESVRLVGGSDRGARLRLSNLRAALTSFVEVLVQGPTVRVETDFGTVGGRVNVNQNGAWIDGGTNGGTNTGRMTFSALGIAAPVLRAVSSGSQGTQESTTARNVEYVSGPHISFKAPPSGRVMLHCQSYVKSSTAGDWTEATAAVRVPGNSTPFFTDPILACFSNVFQKSGATTMVDGLTPGSTYEAYFLVSSQRTTNTATISTSRIIVEPCL